MAAACTVVMHHYVRNVEATAFPAIRGVSVAEFRSQLDFLSARMRVLKYEEFSRALHDGSCDVPSAILTFDDALIDHYETVFPILRERGLTGVFFAPTSVLEEEPRLLNVHAVHFLLARMGAEDFTRVTTEKLKAFGYSLSSDGPSPEGLYRYDRGTDARIKRMLNYEVPFDVADALVDELFREHIGDPLPFAKALYLTSDMVRAMAREGMTFGGHTRTHRVLSRLSETEQREELASAVPLLQDLTGASAIPFGIPYGHPSTYTPETLRILRDCGYDSAFTTVRGTVDFATVDSFEVPRLDTKDLPPFAHA